MTGAGDDAGDRVTIEVLRGAPTDEELAALIAVVSEAYAVEAAAAIADDDPLPSAWAISSRSLRGPLRRELGWGGFGG